MDTPLINEHHEFDLKMAAKRVEERSKLKAATFQEDRRTFAERNEADRLRAKTKAAERRQADKLEAEQIAVERQGVDRALKRHRDYAMDEWKDPVITVTKAIDYLGLSNDLTMDGIYSAFEHLMACYCITLTHSNEKVDRANHARDVLLDYTAKRLGGFVSVPPMDRKRAAALLEIPESANLPEIEYAYTMKVVWNRQPINGMERYIQNKTMSQAISVMLETSHEDKRF
jgi:hypothetical protein